MEYCCICGKDLKRNEIGATMKFLSKSATEFYCREHLAEKLKVSPELIDAKIELFKRQGCPLFS